MLTLRREDDGKPLKVSSGGVTLFESSALDSSAKEAEQGLLSDSDFKKYYQMRVEIPETVMGTKYPNSEGFDVVRFRFEGTATEASACLYNWSYCVRGYQDPNKLKSLKVEGQAVDLQSGSYTLKLDSAKDTFNVQAEIEDSKGYVAVNGKAFEEAQDAEIELTGYSRKLPGGSICGEL